MERGAGKTEVRAKQNPKPIGETEKPPAQSFVTLFDELTPELTPFHDSIVSTFDGTLNTGTGKDTMGIEMVLNPQKNGEILRANLYGLETGALFVSYEPLARGRWCSLLTDLQENTYEYRKLDQVAEEATRQFEEWKNQKGHYPMREWSKARLKRAIWGVELTVMPWEWYEKVMAKNLNEDAEIEAIQNRLEQLASEGLSFVKSNKKANVTKTRSPITNPGGQKDDTGRRLLEDPEFRREFFKNNPPNRNRRKAPEA